MALIWILFPSSVVHYKCSNLKAVWHVKASAPTWRRMCMAGSGLLCIPLRIMLYPNKNIKCLFA